MSSDHEFIDACTICEFIQFFRKCAGVADKGVVKHLMHRRAFFRGPKQIHLTYWRRHGFSVIPDKSEHQLMSRCCQVLRLIIGIGCNNIYTSHRVWFRQKCRWLKRCVINLKCRKKLRRRKMRCKSKWQSKVSGQLGAECTGTQHPYRYVSPNARYSSHLTLFICRTKILQKLNNIVRKCIDVAMQISS